MTARYSFESVDAVVGRADAGATLVGTTHPNLCSVGWSTDEGLDRMAACMLNAGAVPLIVEQYRRMYGDYIYYLYQR